MTLILFPIVVAIFVSSMVFLGYDMIYGDANFENRKIKARVESLFLRKAASSIQRKSSFSNILGLNKALKRQPISQKLFTLLALTGWNMPVSVFIMGVIIWGGVVFVIMLMISDSAIIIMSVTAGAVFFPYWLLVFNKRKYVNKFTIVFPDALMLIKSAIRAGQGVQAAFKMVAQEGPQPVANEFAQVVREIELGSQATEALQELYRRIGTVDLRIFVLGIYIQSEIGGNLVELLSHVESTIRERLSMYREVNALSAQGKMTGLVLMLLPLGLAGVLLAMNPDYFDPLTKTEFGRKLLTAAGVMQIIGAIIIRKITTFKLA